MRRTERTRPSKTNFLRAHSIDASPVLAAARLAAGRRVISCSLSALFSPFGFLMWKIRLYRNPVVRECHGRIAMDRGIRRRVPQRSPLPRGSNALMIAEVLKGMPHSTRAADIRRALQRDKGVSISFPSIRHALNQLAQRGEVETSADHKTWRYAGR
jgi:hypothetical protein